MLAVVLVALVASACEGPVGPAGPEGRVGPQGAPGPVGPTSELPSYGAEGQFGSSGSATMALSGSEIATFGLPTVSCYVSADRITWLMVDHVPQMVSDSYCGVAGVGTTTPVVVIVNGPMDWYYYIVAAY